MKNTKILIPLIVFVVLLFSCTNEVQVNEINQKETDANNLGVSNKKINPYGTVRSSNSLVVRFVEGLTESDKQNLRSFYGVTIFQLCDHCANNAIELWTFNNGVNLEPKKMTIESNVGSISNVDYQFTFQSSTSNSSNPIPINDYHSYIKSENDGITIAVLDSGINPNPSFDETIFEPQFLYNASSDGIAGIDSGWDFANHDNDCFDDNFGLHGTIVTSIITKILNSPQYLTPHQILPLKISNDEGYSNYFDFLCATSYALERATVINMSLGWYDDMNSVDAVDNIFLELMSHYPNTIVINSAGNIGNDNDVSTMYHFPSGYSLGNIIGVASCNEFATDSSVIANISSFSNYGLTTVDYFANGENLHFLGHPVNGTSFAAPKVTALVATIKYLYPDYTPSQIITSLNSIGIDCPASFDSTKKVSQNKILIP
jgi:hypothetical protein